tara:strand:+ start:195 stop:485 length:291 start_codon:yes stop_codon:yes gene_type:complete
MGQDNRIEELEKKIENLKKQLTDARTHTYIGETDSLHCSDGELYIGYNNFGEDCALVMEVNQLFRDLPFIINQVCKEQKKMQQMHLKLIKEAQEEL